MWDQLPLLSWLLNSVVIALLAAGLVTISSSMVAFGFAYFRFPGRSVLFGLVLATMMLPGRGHDGPAVPDLEEPRPASARGCRCSG